jgi:ADP-ribose pyrophosphatase YjhB (NUDIX family)
MGMSGDERERLPLKEDIPLLGRWISRIFQTYWRITRGLRLSVEACVIDETEQALMVVDENGGSWELPRGTVLKNENLEMALRRILRDAADIEVNGKPELSYFYSRSQTEQTGMYLVRDWRRGSAPVGREIRFFPMDALPPDAEPQVAERIRRSLQDRAASEV